MKVTKLQQTSPLQTGIAVIKTDKEDNLLVPLFSAYLVHEANEIVKDIPNAALLHTYCTNSVIGFNIVNTIEDFLKYKGSLPLNYMTELRSGFSNIYNSLEYSPYPICISYT